MINSIPISAIELINITPYNPLISKCQIKVCWVGDTPNRNKSIITKEVAKELANSIPGSPIVGYYNENTEDFEEHNKIIELRNGKFQLKPTTRPYGFIDLNAKVWFQKFSDEGIEREYLVTEGWLWTGQFPECQRVITKGNNHSMELDKETLNAYWAKDANGKNQFFIINEAIMSKLCILGEDFEPCFEGGQIYNKVEFSFEEDFKEQLFSMIKEIKDILDEGGISMLGNDNTPVVDTPVVDTPVDDNVAAPVDEPVAAEPVVDAEPVAAEPEGEPTGDDNEPVNEPEPEGEPATDEPKPEFSEEVCPECGKPVAECTCGEDKPAKYVLDEIPEYIELRNQYSELETRLNEVTSERDELAQFKAGIVKKEKEAMIDQFYMLSDEDKKDVIDNIDSYSLSDIEAKLSVICVRNKVSFVEENNQDNNTTFNLNSDNCNNDQAIPAWIKAVQAVANK